MGDLCLRATSREFRLEITVVTTTQLAQKAQQAHSLGATSAIAMGRLLTSAALLSSTGKREGVTSLQVLSQGRVGQIFADATDEGHLRGMIKHKTLAFPVTEAEDAALRRSVAAAVKPGHLSVIRRNREGDYHQSAVDLVSGEIDLDVEHFLVHSDQVPTVIGCETLLDAAGKVELAAGVLVQALPDGDVEFLEKLRPRIQKGELAKHLRAASEVAALLKRIDPDAEVVTHPTPIEWQCRCSKDRVLRSLQLVPPTELAELIEAAEDVNVDCDFCGTTYPVTPAELTQVFAEIIQGEG